MKYYFGEKTARIGLYGRLMGVLLLMTVSLMIYDYHELNALFYALFGF